MFTLAMIAGRAASKPHISKLKLNNTRKGFFEREQFESVLSHLPEDLRPVIETGYETGWRIDSDILTRQRYHLDLKSGWLRLEPGETKNKEGRMFPLTPRLESSGEADNANRGDATSGGHHHPVALPQRRQADPKRGKRVLTKF